MMPCSKLQIATFAFMFCLLGQDPRATCSPLEPRHKRQGNTRTHASHRGKQNTEDIIRERSKRNEPQTLDQFWIDAQAEAESRRLLDAFGLKTIPKPRKRGETPVEAPEFMLELYRQLLETSPGGGPGGGDPSGPRANTVRCFNEKGASWAGRNRFIFETTGVLSRESVLSAELRVYKRPTRNSRQFSTQNEQVTLQVFHVYNTIDRIKPRKRLVDVRSVNITFTGWLQFNVTSAFNPLSLFPDVLLTGDGNTREFQIKIKSNDEDLKKQILFTKIPKRKRHQNRTPLLVLFLNDNAIAQKDIVLPSERGSGDVAINPDVLDNIEYNEDRFQHENSKRELDVADYNNNKVLERSADPVKRDTKHALELISSNQRTDNDRHREDDVQLRLPRSSLADDRTRRRSKRAPSSSRRANQRLGRNKCQLYDFYVDFQKVGWSDWIIAPNGYTANYCEGYCPFPLDPHFNATNHATVQAILHTRGFTRKGNRLPNPCCVPDKFESIHVLYLDDFNNVVLKEFDDMVATSCGCH